ncbi:hypothetical protein BGZ63DRAFT_355926 [Mariannaea sp. PMI_226]|nr:hypothetical protein BGZ63DRAFT_355926 [Mariannaea sp. PMI_226]
MPAHTDIQEAAAATLAAKPQRLFACLLCQQRKVKCERKFPCGRCVRAGVECLPVSLPRQRRRRFPERDLLERLRHYETLLRQNNVKFEPLHTYPSEEDRRSEFEDDARSELPGIVKQKTGYRKRPTPSLRITELTLARNLWKTISRMIVDLDDTQDNDSVRNAIAKHVWDIMYQPESNDHLLFGSPKNVQLIALHPEQVQIFRLWQVYLENVNPLLKVTHRPTLQARIVNAVSDLANIEPVLEALMFSIYCVSVLSLTEEECDSLFGSPKKDILASYQSGCQQALFNCKALQSNDQDSLTAFYLYLVSIRPNTDPRSLSSMLTLAIHIARRMGIHEETSNSQCHALEAEMRRRLWWSLVIFDDQVCDMLDYHTATLAPTWDCRALLNVDDSELRLGMKTPPSIQEKPTEALFMVARSELSDFVRHSTFHHSLNDNVHAEVTHHSGHVAMVEQIMEDKYLKFCDSDNPLHFMTIWTIRSQLAKQHLLEHYSVYSLSSTQQTEEQRRTAISHAIKMLDHDTTLISSPLTKGYRWLIQFHFPFIAYAHILQALRQWAADEHCKTAWDAISNNYKARLENTQQGRSIFVVFSRGVLQAWKAREALSTREKSMEEPPWIVTDVRKKLTQMKPNLPQAGDRGKLESTALVSMDESAGATVTNTGFGDFDTEGQCFTGPDQGLAEIDADQFWTTIDWGWLYVHSW